MKISLIQSDIIWDDPLANVSKYSALASDAVNQGGELLVFPEMFSCGFSLPVGALAEEAGIVGSEFLRATAQRYRVYTLGSVPEVTSSGQIFNTAFLFAPDGSLQKYRKLHLFSFGDEPSKYSPGEELLSTVIHGLRCTIFICYDLRFTIPFSLRAQDTDIFIVVANWPNTRREHWITLLRARAIEYQCYVAGVNRIGTGGGLTYVGDSALFAPDGSPIVEMGDKEGVATVAVEQERVIAWRDMFPALRDRRPECYGKL